VATGQLPDAARSVRWWIRRIGPVPPAFPPVTGGQPVTLDRELTVFELEVGDAMTSRRTAALRLIDVLERDLSGYEAGMASVEDGLSMEILMPPAAGQIRQHVSEAITDFEAARHRFRLALVALAVDHGMTARQIGETFAFSRQLASRYLKEAKARWPELESPHDLDDTSSSPD